MIKEALVSNAVYSLPNLTCSNTSKPVVRQIPVSCSHSRCQGGAAAAYSTAYSKLSQSSKAVAGFLLTSCNMLRLFQAAKITEQGHLACIALHNR
jgi:hypothetical protein